MRKLKITFLITIFLIVAHLTCYAETGVVNVSATRVRKEPNTSSEILTVIYEDDKVEILGEENDWYKVTYKSDTGYVKKEFIKVSSSNNEKNDKSNSINNNASTNNVSNIISTTNTTNNTQNVTSSEKSNQNTDVNTNVTDSIPENISVITKSSLRLIPSFMSRTTSSVEEGKEYKKICVLNEWVQITDGTATGWIPKSKLKLDNNTQNNENKENENSNNSNTENTNTVEQNKNDINTENTVNTSNSIKNETTNTVNNTSKVDSNTNTSNNEKSNDNNSDSMPKSGKINVETARVREGASASSEIIDGLDYGTKVEILAENGDWYKVKVGDIEGYVSKRLISTSGNTTSRSLVEARENEKKEEKDTSTIDENTNNTVNSIMQNATASSANGTSVVEYAKQFLGYPYVSAGKTPQTGFDCSGFTRYVFLNFGVTLGGSAASQVGAGTEVSRDGLIAGDLLLFYDEGRTKIGHTGIYIGGGNFIHAANPSRGVVIDNLNSSSYYNTRFVTARRIVN